MARREDIVNTFWDDVDHLSDDAVMLYVWSWTNTKCGMAGIYRIARRKVIEGRFEDDRLKAALDELEADGKLRYVDGVLWNCARVSRLSGISENYAKSIARDLREVATNPLAGEFLKRYGDHPKLKGHLTLGEPSAKGLNGPNKPDSEGLGKGSRRDHGTGTGYGALSAEDRSTIEREV